VPGDGSLFSNFADPRFQETNLFSGDPAFQDFTTRQYRIGYAFEHRFGPMSCSGRTPATPTSSAT